MDEAIHFIRDIYKLESESSRIEWVKNSDYRVVLEVYPFENNQRR